MVDRWEEKSNLLFPVNNRCNFLVLAHHTVKLFVTLKVNVHGAQKQADAVATLFP